MWDFNLSITQNSPFNHGFDKKNGEYICAKKSHIAYRYEIIMQIGKGSFGSVYECKDHKTGKIYALKI